MIAHKTEDGWWIVRPSEVGEKLREGTEQASFVSWCWAARIPVHHSPNGARISIGQAKKLKAEGVSPGFPDLILPTKRTVMEFKTADGGVTSDDQKYWLTVFASIGWTAAEVHGEEAARWVLSELCDGGRQSVCR